MEVTGVDAQVDGDPVGLPVVEGGEDALAWCHGRSPRSWAVLAFWRLARSRLQACAVPKVKAPAGRLDEQDALLGVAEAALAHHGSEAGEQPRPSGAAAVLRPVALPGGVQAERDVAEQAVLGRPLQELQRAVRLVASSGSPGRTPRGRRWRRCRAGRRGRRPCRRARGRRGPGRRRARTRTSTCSSAPVPPSQWVRMGQPVRAWAMAAAAKTRSSRALGPPVEPAIFMTPGAVRRALDDGPAVVELVDARPRCRPRRGRRSPRPRGARSSGGRGSSARGGGRSGR